jgi:D-sedoheptulose 7-phosphate isomerase
MIAGLMLEQRIQQQFFESADLMIQAAPALARALASAADALVTCVTAGGKLMIAGQGDGVALAGMLTAALVGRFERERPPLAAMALRGEGPISPSQQLRALGAPGDLLIVFDPLGQSAGLLQAAEAAHEQEMAVIAFAGEQVRRWEEALEETDVLVPMPSRRSARVVEAQLLSLHCLCDAVDLQLLGEPGS